MKSLDYISAAEAATKWQVSVRWVQKLCREKRVPGAIKLGKSWLLPLETKKPGDPRSALSKPPQNKLLPDFLLFVEATVLPLPFNNPDEIINIAKEPEAKLQYEAELSYLRGDFSKTMDYFKKTKGNDITRLRMSITVIASAISMGDYQTYTELENYLKSFIATCSEENLVAVAQLSLANAAVSCMAPAMAPEWLKDGNLGSFPPSIRPYALYLRAKYMQCINKPEIMLAVAQTALTLSEPERGISQIRLYLRLCCAIACYSLERYEKAREYLRQTMALALPHGFITPFAESIIALGGMVEQCLDQEFPHYRDAVLEQWKGTYQNWITFHNQFTKDNLTLVLTLREYHIAQMVARHIPYAKIARQQSLSIGRVKNIMLVVYEKLFISGREELAKYVF